MPEDGPIFPKSPLAPNASIFTTEIADHQDTAVLFAPGARAAETVASLTRSRGEYGRVIGVDRGIVEARIVADHLGIPLGPMSYEFYLGDEAGLDF